MMEAAETWEGYPGWVESLVREKLEPGETPLAWFEPDLTSHLHYAAGLVILTDRRVLSFEWDHGARPNAKPPATPKTYRDWPLSEGLTAASSDHAGIGTLELLNGDGMVAYWRYTVARAASARKLAERLEALQKGVVPKAKPVAPAAVTTECSVCGYAIRAGDTVCSQCGTSVAKPPILSLFRLLSIAKSYWFMSVLGTILTLAATASGLIAPYLTMPLLDDILIPYQNGKPAQLNMIPWYLLGLGGASVLAWLLTWGEMYVMSWVSESVSAELRDRTYSHLQTLSLEYFGGKRTGDLMSRISSDTDRICYFLSVYVLDFVTDVLMLVMTAVILLKINFNLALVTLCPLPFIAFSVFRVQEKLGRGFSLSNRAWADMTSVLADTIPGIRVVKAFAQEEREIQRFRRSNNRVLRVNNQVNKVWAYFTSVVVLLTDLGVLVIWFYGVRRVVGHSITVGVLTAFVTYISRFYGRLDSMSRMVSATQRAAASAQRVFGVLDRVPKVAEAKEPIHPGQLEGGIEIRQVNFRYGTRPILKNLNLSIRPGEMIGLVGQTGAGKTTLINMICRFYDVSEGAILVDGVDIRSYPIGEYRRCVGLVLQEPFLFFGTIAENIAYGRPEATRDEIIAAARAARAHEFILRLPNGYDSLAGERGQFLSGGERQRVSIARALLIDPRILILDEATSSVDTETEREIQLALANLIKGRTTIAIAHRLSTLQRADRLVVMERGEIIEVGPHDELLEKGGAYARLHQAQLDMHEGRFSGNEEEDDDLDEDEEAEVEAGDGPSAEATR
jgi:ATP-binding cassette subfamily B protein